MTALAVLTTVILLGLPGFISPWVSLLGWVCALSIQFETSPDFRLALPDLFVPALALTLLLARTRVRGKTRQKRSSLSALILIFAAVFLLWGNAMTYIELGTIPRWTWLNKDIGLLDLMICFFTVTQLVDRREKLHTLVTALVLSGSLLNILALAGGIARYFFGIPNLMMYASTSTRLVGFMVNPSAYGGFISCILLIQLALLFSGSTLLRLPRWLQGANVVLLSVACIMTISRASILGLIAGLLALISFYHLKATFGLVSLALVAVLTISAVTYWRGLYPGVADNFRSIFFGESTVDARMVINRAAMDMFFESPTNVITGIGVGTFLARQEREVPDPEIIHNEFLWLLVETGVLGLSLFVGMILRSLRNCFAVSRARTTDRSIAVGVACSIVFFLVWMQGGEGLWQRHVWLLLGLSEVCYRLQMKDRSVAPPPWSAQLPTATRAGRSNLRLLLPLRPGRCVVAKQARRCHGDAAGLPVRYSPALLPHPGIRRHGP